MKGKWLLRSGLILFLVCLAIGSPVAEAQQRSPLMLHISSDAGSGDLWAWFGADQPPKQLTSGGHNFSPAISPDGKYVAYNSVPKFAQVDCSGWPPSDIWLLEIATGNTVVIAEQPPNSIYCDHPKPPLFIRRPKPTWSPDSKALAWGESVITPHTRAPVPNRLVVYNLAQRKQQVIVANLPGNQQITHGQEVDWGDPGIANVVFPVPFDTTYSATDVHVYRTNGNPLFSQRFLKSSPCRVGNRSNLWIKEGSKTFLAVCIISGHERHVLIDPLTHRQSEMSGQLELYSPNAPDALSIFSTVDKDRFVSWHIASKGQAVRDIAWRKNQPSDYELHEPVAISPDGRQVVYLEGKQLFIYDQSGQATPVQIPGKESQDVIWAGWGPTAWRIRR
jgi:hypothetical protein